MGCGASTAHGAALAEQEPLNGLTMYPSAPADRTAAAKDETAPDSVSKKVEPYSTSGANSAAAIIAAPNNNTNTIVGSAEPQGGDSSKLLGKDKYVKEYGALAMDDRTKTGESVGQLFLFCAERTDDVVFSYRDARTGSVFARTFTDDQLAEAKTAAGVRFSWAPFFKSLATALLKAKTIVTTTANGRKEALFTIVNSKDTTHSYSFSVQMDLLSSTRQPNAEALYDYVLQPLARSVQFSRGHARSSERDALAGRVECETNVHQASIQRSNGSIEHLLPMIRPLREESAVRSHVAMATNREVRNLERQIKDHNERQVIKHPLDSIYDEGGAQYFDHVQFSVPHHPYEDTPDALLTEIIRSTFPLPAGTKLSSISQILERPDIKRRADQNGNRQIVMEALEIFKGIDQWDYDTIQLEIITNGNALFYTTYLLMYKLDLVSYFKIDDEVLRNFLLAVQSSYHPNPYHNSMHGADVTQINYYIMMVAGLSEKCKLSKEEILAGLLAGPVHDFDHPGLNNNFHSRTNAHLAILYNDRSILENHHLACTFELLRNPRYNVFASLTDEQRQTVRDTMLEMVLATDMGNHAKIFKSFQVRMSETNDWHSKKDDVRLALSMSIKMADISNCARPNHIYAEWAKNISKEFHLQGDAERKLKLSISPFMDRTKEKEDFPKGQISFIMYIVQPMTEAISELLPSLSFTVRLCNENKEYWKRKTDEAANEAATAAS